MTKKIDFENIVANLPQGLLILDAIKDAEDNIIDFNSLYINKSGLNDLGLKEEEVQNKQLSQIFPSDHENLIQAASQVLYYNIPCQLEVSLNGKTFPATITIINNRAALTWHTRNNTNSINNSSINEEIALQYYTLFNAIDEGFCIIEMLFNENDEPFDYRFIELNPAFEN